jgi:hypothetical protein
VPSQKRAWWPFDNGLTLRDAPNLTHHGRSNTYHNQHLFKPDARKEAHVALLVATLLRKEPLFTSYTPHAHPGTALAQTLRRT